MTPDFDEIAGGEGTLEELEDLREVHELLLSASPPPSFTRQRLRAPRIRARVPRWRLVGALSFAAASAVAGVAIGRVAGHDGGFRSVVTKPMHGLAAAPAASAVIQVGAESTAGNRPLRMSVDGLPAAPQGGWYALYLTKNRVPIVPCGIFLIGKSGAATVSLNAPGDLAEYDGWIVTAVTPGHPPQTLLSTSSGLTGNVARFPGREHQVRVRHRP